MSNELHADGLGTHSVPPRRPGARRITVLLFVIAGAALLSIFGPRLFRRPAQPIEVARSELVLRDGRLYRTAATKPFTGIMVERYASGSIKSRSTVADGRLQGRSEGWHPNGQLQIVEHFRAGLSDGPRIKYYLDGSKQSEGLVRAGQFNGTYRRWHQNGHLAEQVEFSQGKPDGLSLSYFETGFLKAQATLRNGTIVARQTWNDGEVSAPPSR